MPHSFRISPDISSLFEALRRFAVISLQQKTCRCIGAAQHNRHLAKNSCRRHFFAIASTGMLIADISLVCLPGCAQVAPAPPAISIAGDFASPQLVTMTASSGAIYFTTDGTVPTISSNLYTDQFYVTSSTQLRAVTFSSGGYSDISAAYAQIDSSLPSAKLWLRASSGVSTDSGSLPLVNSWQDISNSGNNAFAAGSGRPLLNDNSLNGFPTISFDGSTQSCSFPSLSLPGNLGYGISLFVVARPRSLEAGSCILNLHDSTGKTISLEVAASGSYGQLGIYNGTNWTYAQSINPLSENHYQLLEAIQTVSPSSTGTFYVNGASGSASGMTAVSNVIWNGGALGCANSGGNYFQGDIAEAILFPTALTDSQRQNIEAYLIQKYQLLSLIPSTPIFTLSGGILTEPGQVMVKMQPGVTIRITTDGSDPTETSPIYYGAPIAINYTQTLKARSFANGLQSDVAIAVYTLDSTQWPAPSVSDMTQPSVTFQLPVATQ